MKKSVSDEVSGISTPSNVSHGIYHETDTIAHPVVVTLVLKPNRGIMRVGGFIHIKRLTLSSCAARSRASVKPKSITTTLRSLSFVTMMSSSLNSLCGMSFNLRYYMEINGG